MGFIELLFFLSPELHQLFGSLSLLFRKNDETARLGLVNGLNLVDVSLLVTDLDPPLVVIIKRRVSVVAMSLRKRIDFLKLPALPCLAGFNRLR